MKRVNELVSWPLRGYFNSKVSGIQIIIVTIHILLFIIHTNEMTRGVPSVVTCIPRYPI